MTINFEYEAAEELDFNYEELIERVINCCLDYEECPYETEVSVLFTDNEEIQKINSEFRNMDKATDVLSFPTVEYSKAGYFDDLEETSLDCFHPESGELILGDIVISVEKAKQQAEEYGHSLIREIAFLTAHSMLHLMGYDHMTDEERVIMEQKQEDIMELLKISR